MPELKPIGDKIMLHVLARPRESVRDGIVVPETGGREGFRTAIVRALGPRYRGGLGVGDTVMVPPYPEQEVKFNGDTLVLCRDRDVTAVVED